MASALQGIRVVDCAHWYAGPEAAALLGEMGAEVIHVEEPGVGDQSRGIIGYNGIDTRLPDGSNLVFGDHNRNKKSITIDLTKPGSKEIIHSLIEKTDVFITNFRRKAVVKLGIDYDTLSRINPRLIYGISDPYGDKGPDAEAPGFALVAAARSGIMMTSSGGNEEPCSVTTELADEVGAIMLVMGILAALVERGKSGIGQQVISSQLMGLMQLQRLNIALKLLTGHDAPRFDRKNPSNPCYSYYKCQDGRWIALGLLRFADWARFCQAIGRQDIENQPQFTYWMRRRLGIASAADEQKNTDEYKRAAVAFLEELFASKTSGDWLKLLREADLMSAPVNRIADVVTDPQVAANGYIARSEHAALGTVSLLGAPFNLSRTPPSVRYQPPELGQHTEEVLTEICGYTWEQVAAFREGGLI